VGNLSFPVTVQLGLVDKPECVTPDGVVHDDIDGCTE
jgi:hypothetical protein